MGDFWKNLNNDGSAVSTDWGGGERNKAREAKAGAAWGGGARTPTWTSNSATPTQAAWGAAGGAGNAFDPSKATGALGGAGTGPFGGISQKTPDWVQSPWAKALTGDVKWTERMKATPGGAAGAGGTGGTQSGPGILQNWFNQRASGTDPAWLYGTGRAESAINNRFARSGGYNSSGANQAVGDMYANAVSQRQGQLDNLAGGASGEHAGQLDQMFKYGTGLASAQAQTAGGYDTATANGQTQAKIAQIQLMMNKGEVDQKTGQAMIDQMMSFAGTAVSAYGANQGGKGGGATGPTNGSQPLEYPPLANPVYTPVK